VAFPDPLRTPFEAAEASAERLARLTGVDHHDVAIVLGSGWKPAADRLGTLVAEVPLAELGGFAPVTVAGHGDTVRSIRCGDRRVLAFMGRTHLYEDHPARVVVHGVRTAVRAGCSVVVLTNACGGVSPGLRVGEAVLVRDHINLTGTNPLLGVNDDRLGPRFPDLTDAYATRLRALARSVAPDLVEGVYAGFLGPTYETPAEVAMAGRLGADLVGMSTVQETIAAVHAGAEVLAFSLVTNLAAGLSGDALEHDDVLAVAAAAAASTGDLIAAVVPQL